jgi:hypothetical protein
LDPATADALKGHLAGCQECTAFLDTYRGTVRMTANYGKRTFRPL